MNAEVEAHNARATANRAKIIVVKRRGSKIMGVEQQSNEAILEAKGVDVTKRRRQLQDQSIQRGNQQILALWFCVRCFSHSRRHQQRHAFLRNVS